MKPLFILIFVTCLTTSVCKADKYYTSDLKDVDGYMRDFTPIGDLGNIQTIINLRGFIPISAVSKKKTSYINSNIFKSIITLNLDVFKWYKFPIARTISLLYYGKDDWANLSKLSKIKFLKEDKLCRKNAQWANFAYKLTKNNGKILFKSVGGWLGFDGAEPIAIILTEQNAIIIINFKYADIERNGTGQILCGFEFSRRFKKYKTFYDLYSTTIYKRSTKKSYEATKPLIIEAIKLYLTF